MALHVEDEHTIALMRELAARTGADEQQVITAALRKTLAAIDTQGGSYRERRNARVRARSLQMYLSEHPVRETVPDEEPAA